MNLSFLNSNRTLISNAGSNGLAAGSKWRYDNLLTTNGITIYGILTIKEISNATITILDNDATGLPGRFQPEINEGTGGGYVLFDLEFHEVITDNRVYISDYYMTAVDIDGNEFVEAGGYSSYQVDALCGLTITHNATTNRTRFAGISSSLNSITFENTAAFVARYVFPYTKVSFALGKSDTSSGSARQYSVQFGTAGGTFPNPTTTKNPQKLLYITKTCDTDKFVAGSTHKYTVTIENAGSVADSVKLSDPLPAGLTYVPNSTSIYIPASSVTETVADNFNISSYSLNSGTIQWSGEWVEGGETTSPTAGQITIATSRLFFSVLPAARFIERKVDLSRAESATLTFDYPAIALSTGNLNVQVSNDGSVYADLGTLTGTTTGSFSVIIPSQYFSKNTRIRFINSSTSNWASGKNISIDNVKITYSFSKSAQTKTNALSGGTLSNGVPPALLTDADQITLLPGVKATVTFDVAVNCNAAGTIINTATASCPNLYENSISASHTAYVDPTNVTAGSRCGNGTVVLSAAGATGNQIYRWYDTPSGGTPLGTGSTFTTPSISSSTDYYVSFYNPDTGCETGRTKVTATISAGISGTGTISSTTGANGSILNTGTISASGAANNTGAGTVAWSNTGNITSSDNNRTSVTLGNSAYSNYLDVSLPITTIPLSTITGISVSIERFGSYTTSIRDAVVKLLKNSTEVGDNKAMTTTDWPTSEGTVTYGSSTDLWGTTWFPSDFSTLGLRIQVRNNTTNNRTAYIDYVSVTVYYTAYGDDQSSVKFTASGITGATGYNWTVPTSATISSGQGTDNIFVNFNNAGQSGTYNVCVTPVDACGNGAQICQSIQISNNTNNEISGTIYNDPNGSATPNKVDGTPVSSIAGQQLYAILATNATPSIAISSIAIAPNGSYKFSYLTSTVANYYRIFINTVPFGDGATVTAGAPLGASFNGAIDNDATNSLTGGSSTNGYLNVTAGNNTNNTNVNFGLQLNNPVANNDNTSTNEDTSVSINVTTNDTDPNSNLSVSTVDLDPTTAGIQNSVTNEFGTWVVNSSGQVTFTPVADYYGTASINYVVSDATGYLSNIAKLTVTVNPVDDIPSFTKGSNITVNEDAGAQTVSGWATNIVKGPSNESLQTVTFPVSNNNNDLFSVQPYINSNGDLIFTPMPNVSGVATVTVKIKDDGGTANGGIDESATQTFTITVNPVNDAPVAINDINTTYINQPVSGQVLTNDSDPEGNTLTVTTQSNVSTAHGTVTVNSNGTYNYTPANGYTGTDTFSYQVCDNGSPSQCNTASVTINVVPPTNPLTNDPPVANNDTYTVEQGQTATVKVLANDSDPDGNTITVTSATGLNISGGTLTLTGTPQNVYDLSKTLAGTAYLNASGQIVFTPTATYTGNVPFNYTISDGNGGTASASALITVLPANATNDVNANDDAKAAPAGNNMTGNILTNDSDPEGNSFNVTGATANGTTLTIGTATAIPGVGTLNLASDGTYTFVPVAGYVGTVNVPYTICDGGTPSACDQATLYLTSLPVTPSAQNDIHQVPQGVTANGTVLTNDSYTGTANVTSAQYYNNSGVLTTLPIGTATDIYIQGGTTKAGSMTLNSDGTYTFVPTSGFTGTVPVNYTITDTYGTGSATLNINVIPLTNPLTNDPPVANNDTYTVEQGQTATVEVLANDSDPDGNTITVTSATGLNISGGTLTLTGTPQNVYDLSKTLAGTAYLNASGQIVLTPTATYTGNVPFNYTISDGKGGTASASVLVTVLSANTTNDLYANDDAKAAPQGVTLTGNVLTNDSDPEGNTFNVSAVTIPAQTINGINVPETVLTLGSAAIIANVGTITITQTGDYTFAPVATFTGTLRVPYTIKDSGTTPIAIDQATLYLTSLKSIIKVWTGTTSTDFNTSTNWSMGVIPVKGDDIVFATVANYGSNAINDMILPNGSSIEINNLTNLSTKATIIPANTTLIVTGLVTGSSGIADAAKIQIKATPSASPTTPNGTFIINCTAQSTSGSPDVYVTVDLYAKGFKQTPAAVWTDNITGSPTNGTEFSASYHWQHFGVPVETIKANPAFYGSFIRKYHEDWNKTVVPSKTSTYYAKWEDMTNESILDAFKGYEITQDEATTYSIAGKLQYCDKTITLTRSAPEVTNSANTNTNNDRYGLGQNIFGNSYTASIDITQLTFPEKVEPTVYLYNTGRFTDWAATTGGGLNEGALAAGQHTSIPKNASPVIYDGKIPSLNGFLLMHRGPSPYYASNSDASVTMTLPYANNLLPNTRPQTVARKPLSYLKVNLQSKTTRDNLWLFSQEGTTKRNDDGWDGRKFFGTPTAFIYTENADGPKQVNTDATIDGSVLSFYANDDTDYTLTLTKSNLEGYTDLQLIDLVAHTVTPLTGDVTTYRFTADSKGMVIKRFIIANSAYVNLNSNRFKYLDGYVLNNNRLIVSNLTTSDGVMYLYDISGKTLINKKISTSITDIPVSLKTGIYILNLQADGKLETIKLIIK